MIQWLFYIKNLSYLDIHLEASYALMLMSSYFYYIGIDFKVILMTNLQGGCILIRADMKTNLQTNK